MGKIEATSYDPGLPGKPETTKYGFNIHIDPTNRALAREAIHQELLDNYTGRARNGTATFTRRSGPLWLGKTQVAQVKTGTVPIEVTITGRNNLVKVLEAVASNVESLDRVSESDWTNL